MDDNSLQQRLDKGRYGTPLAKPEEQHRYLGTFRERCYLSMTIRQMQDPQNKACLITELKKQPAAVILLNGKLPESLQSAYIELATKQQTRFTVINDFVDDAPESFGLLVVAKQAVNEEVIDVEKKYPRTEKDTAAPEPEKESFWKKLFH